MSWLDIFIIVFLAVFILGGLKNGIIKSILSLVGIILGVMLAGRYYVPLSQVLTFISEPGVAKITAFAIILIGIMIITGILASFLGKIVSVVMLGWANRLGGAIFGLLVGGVFFGAALATWIRFLGIGQTIADSNLAMVLLDYFPVILALLPDEFNAVRSFFQ